MRTAQASGSRKTAPWRCRVCAVAPGAGDAAAWGARLLEHAAVAWGGREGRVQRLAEVLSAPEAHLPAVIARRDALAAGQHCMLCVVCRACTRLMSKPLCSASDCSEMLRQADQRPMLHQPGVATHTSCCTPEIICYIAGATAAADEARTELWGNLWCDEVGGFLREHMIVG